MGNLGHREFSGVMGKWNIEEYGDCRDGCPRLKNMDEHKSMDEK